MAKSGRSTGLTCDAITGIDTTIEVEYSSGCSTTTFTETYNDEVIVEAARALARGDSGSLIVDAGTAEPVALLFAEIRHVHGGEVPSPTIWRHW